MQDQISLYSQSPKISYNPQQIKSGQARSLEEKGYCTFSNLADPSVAQRTIEETLESLDLRQVPTLRPFNERIQLGKFNRIPSRSCPEAVECAFLALHFEMGFPLAAIEKETMFQAFLCLYFPHDEPLSETSTRLFSLGDLSLEVKDRATLEKNLISYAKNSSDGWKDWRSGRVAPLGRLLEALRGTDHLDFMFDHHIADWFSLKPDGSRLFSPEWEAEFFEELGVNLREKEILVTLKPGDLLIVDNTRVAHGRYGKRTAESLDQWLYGVSDATPGEIDLMREGLIDAVLEAQNT